MLEKFYGLERVTGVTIDVGKDGVMSLNACEISVQGEQLQLERKLTGMSSIKELAEKTDLTLPLALNLAGKGFVLYKQLGHTEPVSKSNFEAVLVGADIDNYYIQQFISGDSSFVAMIRRTDADLKIAELSKAGFKVSMLGLGPFPAEHVLEQLNVYGEEVVFDGHVITRSGEGNWLAYRNDPSRLAEFPLKIDIEPIDQQLILPYAAAFQLLLAGKLDPVCAAVPSLEATLKKTLADKKLKVQAVVTLGIVFLALLVNFLVMSSFEKENRELAIQAGKTDRNSSDLQRITETVAQKDSLIQALGWEEGSRKSVLADQLAALLPGELTLSSILIDPVDDHTGGSRKDLRFLSKQIIITGTSALIIPVNEWMARIKTKAWVKSVRMENYSFSNELNTGQFSILITY